MNNAPPSSEKPTRLELQKRGIYDEILKARPQYLLPNWISSWKDITLPSLQDMLQKVQEEEKALLDDSIEDDVHVNQDEFVNSLIVKESDQEAKHNSQVNADASQAGQNADVPKPHIDLVTPYTPPADRSIAMSQLGVFSPLSLVQSIRDLEKRCPGFSFSSQNDCRYIRNEVSTGVGRLRALKHEYEALQKRMQQVRSILPYLEQAEGLLLQLKESRKAEKLRMRAKMKAEKTGQLEWYGVPSHIKKSIKDAVADDAVAEDAVEAGAD